MKMLFPFVIIGMTTTAALGHEAESGWRYPFDCCGDGDCSVAETGEKNGRLTLKTPMHGEREIPPEFKNYRPSPDGKWHLCANLESTRIYCIFGPEGT